MQMVHCVQGMKAIKYRVKVPKIFLSISLHYADFPIVETHLFQDAEHCVWALCLTLPTWITESFPCDRAICLSILFCTLGSHYSLQWKKNTGQFLIWDPGVFPVWQMFLFTSAKALASGNHCSMHYIWWFWWTRELSWEWWRRQYWSRM